MFDNLHADGIYFLSMPYANTITTRQMLREYKAIFARVQSTKEPAVIVSQKQPQVAIVSLDDLTELETAKQRKSTQALKTLAGLIPKGSGLPADLSERHDEYTWG